MTDRESYIALNLIQELGPIRVRALVEAFGSPQSVIEASADQMMRIKGIGPALARRIVEGRETADPLGEQAQAEELGVQLITWLDDDYPEPLRQIHDPPLVLYVKGMLRKDDEQALAIVGSRRCSHYGRMVADRLSYQVAKAGFTVISGLARGIDTAAHQGALKAKGRTIAILGGALDRLYPPDNKKLAEQIEESGAVLSEFPFGREPDRTTFPYRNRIVSGMSRGVLVVESPAKSGSLITAEQAMEQGRTVFAVPGRIDSPGSGGCHMLLKQGARLVDRVDDILDEFDALTPPRQRESGETVRRRVDIMLDDAERRLLEALGTEARSVDELTRRSEMDNGTVSGMLLVLEMKRVVRMLPGRMVELAVDLSDFGAVNDEHAN